MKNQIVTNKYWGPDPIIFLKKVKTEFTNSKSFQGQKHHKKYNNKKWPTPTPKKILVEKIMVPWGSMPTKILQGNFHRNVMHLNPVE